MRRERKPQGSKWEYSFLCKLYRWQCYCDCTLNTDNKGDDSYVSSGTQIQKLLAEANQSLYVVPANLWKCSSQWKLCILIDHHTDPFPYEKLRIPDPGCVTQVKWLLLTTPIWGLICTGPRLKLLFPYMEMTRLAVYTMAAQSLQVLCSVISIPSELPWNMSGQNDKDADSLLIFAKVVSHCSRP